MKKIPDPSFFRAFHLLLFYKREIKMDKPNIPISSSLLPLPTPEGVEKFLSGNFVKGIGKVFAKRIVDNTGLEILSPDFNFKETLQDIPGLSSSKIQELEKSLKDLPYPSEVLALLYSSGLSDSDVEKILSHYKKNTARVLAEDPYQMVEEVFKLSFFTADKVGRFMKINPEDPRRLGAALVTAVKIYAENGSMFARQEEAIATASRIAGVSPEKIAPEIDAMVNDGRLVKSHNGLYLPVYYKAEKEGAEKLAALIKAHRHLTTDFPLPSTDREGHPLSEGQIKAITTVMQNPVTIITGGPGTGKTTTIRGVIKLLEDHDKKVVLAAPTGRAAKRLSDLSGHEAKTIHRLLGYSQGRGYKNKHFDADILIIDEASMLEQVLFNHLLQALKEDTKVVLVGDTHQLPAIGAGDVLSDMIKSGTVPVVTLEENFRQKEGSEIARNATAIRKGLAPDYSSANDFMIIAEESPRKILSRLISMVKEELPDKLHISPKDIQVVTPQQEGPLGAKQLNIDIQEAVNPAGPELKHGMKLFRKGDRVMQTSNSSERHTYNGETGWVSEIDPEGQWLEVTFNDGKISRYLKKELRELSLAYATTVHKLQGSETDYLVMPMTLSHRPMLYRNLLYTGVSRARKMCVLVGEEKAIRTAIDNHNPNERNSNFKIRLRENLPQLSPPENLPLQKIS